MKGLHEVVHRDEQAQGARSYGLEASKIATRVKIEKINNFFQVDINRREQGCAAHYEQYCELTDLHRRTGRGGRGGSCPPQKITKSKSRANVQHKSGEEWEIKKPKSPQFVGQTKAVGQYSLHSRAILAYYKKNWDKLCEFCG